MSDWYDKTSTPTNNSFGSSAGIRSEFALVEAATAKLPAMSGNPILLVRVNATAASLEAVTAYESITDDHSLDASDSNRSFGLNDAAGCTVTLPAIGDVAVGWKARFRVETAPSSGNYVITEKASDDTNILVGGVNEREVDTGDDGPYTNGFTQVNFIQSVAVPGDYIDIESNGTNYFVTGVTNADGGATLT